MECNIVSTAVQQPCLTRIDVKVFGRCKGNVACWNRKSLRKLNRASLSGTWFGPCHWKVLCTPVTLVEDISALQSNSLPTDHESDSDEGVGGPLSSEQLRALIADSERSKLINKLSEANRHNRFMKRQLQVKDEAIINFKSELADVELEIQAMVSLAQEIAKYSIPDGSRKIRGKYIQSHLLSRLEAVQKKLKEQIKDVDAVQSREVPLFWCGVAESVQVMGSFDGWSVGENLSPEYTGLQSTFSTTLMLRPGRYEIKFMVDGDWKLSPEYPTVGEGLMQNNLLVVE